MKMKLPLFLAALLVLGLALFGAATPALAAPAAQDAPADTTQVWMSDVYPAADAPGMLQMVALYPNNAAEVVSIYLTKGAIVESGTWEAGDDGAVTVTLTGNAEREYDEPVSMSFTSEDGMLSDGVFSYHLLDEVTPEEMDAMTSGEGEATAAEGAETHAMGDIGRVWVSNVYPAADASGLVTVLALYENGNMEQTSIYLGKGATTEVGTWEEDADGAVAVTITGTTDKEYDEPQTTTYQHVDDTLVDGAFVLTLWPEVTPDDMMAATDPSGTYATNVYPAADAAGYIAVLALFANNNAEQTTIYLTKGAVSEVGVWAEEVDGSITVTMTGTLEQEYDEPSPVTYLRDGDLLVDGAFVFFKLDEITPEMMDALTAPAVSATYKSDTLPAADSPGRVITLTLLDDGSLTMSTDFLNDQPPIEEVGTWEENADGTLTVSLTGTPDGEYDQPDVLTFEKDGDQIVAVEYDESMWGSEGLTLTEQPAE
ncbi:MAG: copper resistance protein NlpE [Caldilinea sp.]|nr:copper resistance protein NlpE [Caldilinea sp.]MCW5840370.1 copper resistance protein NlpE N-terminal domain-containing protein [Caldilinea sp.]